MAIKKYCLALQPDRNCPATERQILLSNMVAARLQIGGPTQAEAAVENAKQVSERIGWYFPCHQWRQQ